MTRCRKGFFVRANRSLLATTLGALLLGCSSHPMLDDVAAPLKTEDIVLHVRCEAREQIIHELRKNFGFESDEALAKRVTELKKLAAQLDEKDERLPGEVKLAVELPHERDRDLLGFMQVALAYDFDFNITEQNDAAGGVAFQLPFKPASTFDLSGGAAVHLTRNGQRQFKTQEKWSGLIAESQCDKRPQRRQNAIYPVTGRIGIDRLVTSFVGIAQQDVAKDSFVETLVFTTDVSGGLAAGVKLAPVQNAFRLISASASVAASRKDIHKMVVSMVFPQEYPIGKGRHSKLDAPFDRPPKWRARYNLCVADARGREDTFKLLRQSPPEVYCIKYAEYFEPPPPAAVAPEYYSTRPSFRRPPTAQQNGERQRVPPRSLTPLYYQRVPSYL